MSGEGTSKNEAAKSFEGLGGDQPNLASMTVEEIKQTQQATEGAKKLKGFRESTTVAWGSGTMETSALFKELKLRTTREIFEKIPKTDTSYDSLKDKFNSVVSLIRKIEDIHAENKEKNGNKPTSKLEEKLQNQYFELIPALQKLHADAKNPAPKQTIASSPRAVYEKSTATRGENYAFRGALEELDNGIEAITADAFFEIINSETGRADLQKKLRGYLKEKTLGYTQKYVKGIADKETVAAYMDVRQKFRDLKRDAMPDRAGHFPALYGDLLAFKTAAAALEGKLNALPKPPAEAAPVIAPTTPEPEPQTVSPDTSAPSEPAVAQTETVVEEKVAPKSFVEMEAIMVESYARIRTAAGNPVAIVATKYATEYVPLAQKVADEYSKLHELAENGADPQPERMQTLTENIAKLDGMSKDIAEYLKGSAPASAGPSVDTNAAQAGAPKEGALSANTEKLLDQSKAFREQFRGVNDLEKGRDENGKWYVKEKGKLGEALGAYYTRGLFARIGSGARSLVGINPPGLSPELKARKTSALEAAKAYSASIEKRYSDRLARELAAGRIDMKGVETKIAQFRSMTANRFVLQPVTMLHDAERKALTDAGGGALAKFGRWYGSLPLPGKIAVGTAVTVGAGAFAGATAAAMGARAGFKAIMVSTGWGALIGKTTSDFVTGGAHENVRKTIMSIGDKYETSTIETQQAELMDSLRTLDRRKTIAVAASAAVGAGVAGGGVLAGEHLADTFSSVDTHADNIGTLSQHVSPDARHDSVPQISNTPAAPDTHLDKIEPAPAQPVAPVEPATPQIPQTPDTHLDTPAAVPAEPAPNVEVIVPQIDAAASAEHLQYHVVENDTLWKHAETTFDKDLRANFETGHERDVVLMNLRERLIQNPDLAKEIGITSGNPDKIEWPHTASDGTVVKGDVLDDTKLDQLIKEEINSLKIGVDDELGELGDTITDVTPSASILDAVPPHDADASTLEAYDNANVIIKDLPSAPVAASELPPVPGSVVPEINPTVTNPIPEPVPPGARYEFPTVSAPTIPTPDATPSLAPDIAASTAFGAGVASTLENSRFEGRVPVRAEVEKRKTDLINLIEKPKPVSRIGRFFGSIAQTDIAPQTPYEVLKNMSVTSIAETLAAKPNETDAVKAAREGRKAAFVRENRIDAKVFEHWMDNFGLWKRIIVGSDTKLADSMTFDTLLEKISQYQLERGEILQG